jgi:predicted nucleic acid-binding Zn ribbon protein
MCASHYYTKRNSEARAAMRSKDRPCATCGGSLAGKRPNAKFCSEKCKYDAQDADRRADVERRRKGRICAQCGGPIAEETSLKAQTCSKKCSVDLQNAIRQQAIVALRESRQCERCGKTMPADKRLGSIYCSEECKKIVHDARWREQHPHYNRMYLYNLSAAEYEAMLAAQDNRCAICRTDEWGGKHGVPHVDHCHSTNKVRGLLCDSCNAGLGRFKDNPEALMAAASYIVLHEMPHLDQ